MVFLIDPTQTDESPWVDSETIVQFLRRSSLDLSVDLRTKLNQLVEVTPPELQAPMTNRLNSRDRDQVDQTVWELFVGWWLQSQQDFKVEYQPSVTSRNGNAKTPDYRVLTRDGACYVDAFVMGEPGDVVTQRSLVQSIVNEVNARVVSDDICFWFEIHEFGSTTPPLKRICQELQEFVIAIRPDLIRRWEAARGPLTWLPKRFEAERNRGWSLEFTPYSLILERSETWVRGPIIGIGPSRTFLMPVVAMQQLVREKLETKVSKYKNLDAPIVPFMLLQRDFYKERELETALMGSDLEVVATNHSGNLVRSRSSIGAGLWTGVEGPRSHHVPCVLTGRVDVLQVLHDLSVTAWHCPSNSLSVAGTLNCRHQVWNSQELSWVAADSDG